MAVFIKTTIFNSLFLLIFKSFTVTINAKFKHDKLLLFGSRQIFEERIFFSKLFDRFSLIKVFKSVKVRVFRLFFQNGVIVYDLILFLTAIILHHWLRGVLSCNRIDKFATYKSAHYSTFFGFVTLLCLSISYCRPHTCHVSTIVYIAIYGNSICWLSTYCDIT